MDTAVAVSCTRCRRSFHVTDAMMGRTVICPGCNVRVFVPIDDGPIAYSPPPRQRRRKRSAWGTLILTATATFLAGLWYLNVALSDLTKRLSPEQEIVRRHVDDPKNTIPGTTRWIKWWPAKKLDPGDARELQAESVVMVTVEADLPIIGRTRRTNIYFIADGKVVRGRSATSQSLTEINIPDRLTGPGIADRYYPDR